MLLELSSRKILDILSERKYRCVNEKCKRCCKTCERYFKDKSIKKDICYFLNKEECEAERDRVAFYDVDTVEIITRPTNICSKWKPKKSRKKK